MHGLIMRVHLLDKFTFSPVITSTSYIEFIKPIMHSPSSTIHNTINTHIPGFLWHGFWDWCLVLLDNVFDVVAGNDVFGVGDGVFDHLGARSGGGMHGACDRNRSWVKNRE